MFLEYDWTYGVFRPRFGRDTFIEIGGFRSFSSWQEAKLTLMSRGLKIGRKTDSRTWRIELDKKNGGEQY